jgi:hypothetical protein
MRIDEALYFISFTNEIGERLLHASDLFSEVHGLLAGTCKELVDGLTLLVRRDGVGVKDILEGRVHDASSYRISTLTGAWE